MSTTRSEKLNTVAADTPNATMPSCESNNNHHNMGRNINNNGNVNTSNNNNNSYRLNTEQPQTKRQKIEQQQTKSKNTIPSANKNNHAVTSSTSMSSTTTTILHSLPNIGQRNSSNENNNHKSTINMEISSINNNSVNNKTTITTTSASNHNRHMCSSSSLHSASSSPSSLNNSPNSTPSSSRATSYSQLLNVQNLSNKNNSITQSTQRPGNTTQQQTGVGVSTDEVDRISRENTIKYLPHIPSLPSTLCNNDLNVNQINNVKLTHSLSMSAINLTAAGGFQDMSDFEESLKRQCLCGVSENALRKPFQSHYYFDATGQKRIASLSEWPTSKLIQFLSNLQLLFEIYLKQNSKGFICSRIIERIDFIRNDHNLIDEIIVLAAYNNPYVQFLAGRVLASFLVIAKCELDDNWLKKIVDNLFSFEMDRTRDNRMAVKTIHFSLDIIKRIVEWKDVDLHPLEDEIADNNLLAYSGVAPVTHTNASSTFPVNDINTVAESGVVQLMETHTFLHFPVRQHSLDENYFAIHFGALPDDTSDDDANRSSRQHHNRHQRHNQNLPSATSQRNNNQEQFRNFTPPSTQAHNNMYSNHNHQQQQQPQLHTAAGSTHRKDHPAHQSSLQNWPTAVTSTTDPELIQQQQQHNHYEQNTSCASQVQLHHPNLVNFDLNERTTTYYSNNSSNNIRSCGDPSATSPSNSLISTIDNSRSVQKSSCQIVTLTDSESFDTTHLKCITIKTLEHKWEALVNTMSELIVDGLNVEDAESSVLTFLQLWENIISVKANLSIDETLPFYSQLARFETLLSRNLSCTVYKQMLSLFNEALCYGSTLALQDMLPKETCSLAHQIVRHVKSFRMLETLPRRQSENVAGLIGYKGYPIAYESDTMEMDTRENGLSSRHILITTDSNNSMVTNDNIVVAMDKTILQKMVLLVLKSIAVSVKEIRSDSSDSSIDSIDSDAQQDMVLIEQSMRDVLQKLEAFIKQTLEFHPQCHFSKILIRLFDDQDDHLIEAMVCTLDVTAGLSYRKNAFPELVNLLNPVYTFLEFLKMISNSSDLLLDLLVSNETCFLLYLLRFLKYVRSNWLMFVFTCHDFGMGANTLEETMGVLNRLRMQISRLVSRQLFPYDISPVLRLLEHCDSLYDGNDLA